MKKQILATAVAALSFAGVACTEQPSSKIAPKPTTPRPVITHKAEPKPQPVSPTQQFVVEPTVKDLDVLALSHEDGRNVDHLSRAVQMRDIGDFAGALAEARRALYDSPEDIEVLAQIDRLTKLSGEKELRIAALERLAKLQPQDATPLVQQARVLLSMKDFEGAIAVGTEATRRDGNNPESWQAIGRAHLSLGQLAPAITMFEKVIALKPDHGHALNNLGFAYLRANRNQDAVAVLTRAAEQLPNVAWVHNNLGVAMERVGRLEEAKEAYARSSYLSPKYLKAQLNVSRVASLSGFPTASDESPMDSMSDLPIETPTDGPVDGTEAQP